MPNCIYCNISRPYSEEHPLPACLGEFRNFPLLLEQVCNVCNHKIGKSEQQFCRCGPEAFFRTIYGVEGREHHDKVNVYKRGSFGGKPIDFIGINPALGLPILYEKIPQSNKVRIISQIIVIDVKGGVFPIRLQKWMKSTEDVRNEIKKHTLEKMDCIRVIPEDDEVEWVQELLKGFGGNFKWEKPLEPHTVANPVAEVKVTTPFFQAIAKIGFHYFLAVCKDIRGDEDEFSEIRNFIINGIEKSELVTQEDKQIIFGPPNAVPNRLSHVLSAETFDKVLYARMQLFIGPDCIPLTYRIVLSQSPVKTPPEFASGHVFVYFEDGKHGKYSGEAFPLDVKRIPGH